MGEKGEHSIHFLALVAASSSSLHERKGRTLNSFSRPGSRQFTLAAIQRGFASVF
jgi:hypothetical protein